MLTPLQQSVGIMTGERYRIASDYAHDTLRESRCAELQPAHVEAFDDQAEAVADPVLLAADAFVRLL